MKFQHFTRYYYEIDFDWRKLDYLVAFLRDAHPVVHRNLERCCEFPSRIEDAAAR